MRGSAVYVGEQRTLTPAKDRVTRHLHYAVSTRENRYGHWFVACGLIVVSFLLSRL